MYLLQKREEMAISLAVTAPNSKLIDGALASNIPVSPVRNMVYLIALALGILIPIGIIYVSQLLDTKLNRVKILKEKLQFHFWVMFPNLIHMKSLSVQIAVQAPLRQ